LVFCFNISILVECLGEELGNLGEGGELDMNLMGTRKGKNQKISPHPLPKKKK
jgi:hypothetical protein